MTDAEVFSFYGQYLIGPLMIAIFGLLIQGFSYSSIFATLGTENDPSDNNKGIYMFQSAGFATAEYFNVAGSLIRMIMALLGIFMFVARLNGYTQ